MNRIVKLIVWLLGMAALPHAGAESKLRRPPSVSQLYAPYNMGLSSFALCDYRISRVNPATARKCRQVQAMVDGKRD